MNKYQFKTKTELGTTYYYCYADDRFERYMSIKKLNFKKLKENRESGKNLFNEQNKEIERLNNIIKRFEDDLREMYLTFGEFSEEYTEKRIQELKESNK